jgi:hypothetical protein
MRSEEYYSRASPRLGEEPSKKRVQCGPVKTGALDSGSLLFGPPGGLADGVQSTMKSASTWLLTTWRGTKSNSNSANSAAHLVILPVVLGLQRMVLSGYEVTTEIL